MVAAPLAGNILGSDAENFVIAEWRDPGGSTFLPDRFSHSCSRSGGLEWMNVCAQAFD
jgi:hypothetical protein